MRSLNVNCNWGIFLHAFTYSTNFLIFSITIVVASILCVWLYEKPLIYKLIFKKSEHSNSVSSKQSDKQFLLVDDEVSNMLDPKRMKNEIDGLEYAKILLKKSEHSNSLSTIQSDKQFLLVDEEVSNMIEPKRLTDLSNDGLEFTKVPESM